VAFGDRPADPIVVRPGDPPAERWAAAVAVGARGRYGAARALLDALRLDPATPPALRAHAAVTRAAHLRQLGGHRVARRWDGAGLALATAALATESTTDPAPGDPHPGRLHPAPGDPHPVRPHPGDVPDTATASTNSTPHGPHRPRDRHPVDDLANTVGAGAPAAWVDALLGLSADALGLGDLALSARLLASAESAARGHPSWRPLVRWRWVRAELALARDEPGDAIGLACAAGAAARAANAVRHEVKSDLIEVVARRCAGEGTASLRRPLERLTERTIVTRLGSLEWPTRSVLGELLSGVDPSAARAQAARVAALMTWIRRSADPFGRSVIDRSPWVSDVSARSLLHSEACHPSERCRSAQHSRMECEITP
jgi:hypothetical protein